MPSIVNNLKKKLIKEADSFTKRGIFPSAYKSQCQVYESQLPPDSPYLEFRTVPYLAQTSECLLFDDDACDVNFPLIINPGKMCPGCADFF